MQRQTAVSRNAGECVGWRGRKVALDGSDNRFAVSVFLDELHFNAAHFINNTCESLHGHNFHVRIDARGNNTEDADDVTHVESFGKRFVFPRENCVVLPVSNTTTEMLAWYICDALIAAFDETDTLANVHELEVAVKEADRQWGIHRHALSRSA